MRVVAGSVLTGALLLVGYSGDRDAPKDCSRRTEAYRQRALIALQMGDVEAGVEQLRVALRLCPQDGHTWAVGGDVWRRTGKYDSALVWYNRAWTVQQDIDPAIYFFAAECAYRLSLYDSAAGLLRRFFERTDTTEMLRTSARTLYQKVATARQLIANPVPFNPVNLGPSINSPLDEYLPALTADEKLLIFTRRARRSSQVPNEDLYISYRTDTGWTLAQPIGKPLNTPLNEGAQTISPDGKIILFVACDRNDGMGSCDIYSTQRIGNHWTQPVNLGYPVNSRWWDSQPTISPNGYFIIFASTRPGSLGGSDLWLSRRKPSGEWTLPENLGTPINTPADEKSPFLHPDGITLYFSSDGHPGLGGMDIFYSRMQPDGTWSPPTNLGYPINTAGDENSLIVSASGSYAYFASDRLGGYGGMDLYLFELYETARPTPVTYISGVVIDKNSRKPLSATLILSDISTATEVAVTESDSLTGAFLLPMPTGKTYTLNAIARDYMMTSATVNLTDTARSTPHHLTLELQPIAIGAVTALRNIYFKFDSWELDSASIAELDKVIRFLQLNSTVKVEIGGHTDSIGTHQYNLTLSEKRAKAVYHYLVSQGIDASRLAYRGYGATTPIAPNTTEEGRRLNRRVELRIVGM